MKTVFSNDMTVHVWAQQTHKHGRSSHGNVRFNGRTLHSYAEPIARFTESADGRPVVLITSETFSVTTSKHRSRAMSAVRGQTVFFVPDTGYDSVEPDHSNNLRHLLKHARGPLGKVSRVPFDSWQAHPVELTEQWANWNYSSDAASDAADSVPLFLAYSARDMRTAAEYAAAFGLVVDMAEAEGEFTAAVEAWRARWARFNTPEAAAKRERAAAYRVALKERKAEQERARQLDSMQRRYVEFKTGEPGFHSRPQSWQFPSESPERADLEEIEAAEREQLRRDAAEAVALWQAGKAPRPAAWRMPAGSPQRAAVEADERRERAEREAERRAQWQAGSSISFHGADEHGGAYLRVRGNPEHVRNAAERECFTGWTLETSLGADVPLAHAVRMFQFCRHVWAELGTWQRNGQTVLVGHFHVDVIDATGMRAGCHWICRHEIERIAAELGIADLPPSAAVLERRPDMLAAE